jgi:hypothetical protein
MIQFDKDVVSQDFTNMGVVGGNLQNMNFGIINLKIKKLVPIKQKRHFVFSIDCSGSMNDLCNDGRTKNDHSNHTLINMITYFAEHPELMVSISVFAFDGSIYTIIENEEVTQENLNKLIQDIKKIRPKDMTNIEKALLHSREYIVNYCTKNMDSNVTHIFMTDGDATQGNTIPSKLKEFVTPLVSNIFIGFGIEHNVYLLKELASDNKNNYYFVDALEKAGLVYGEILHSIIYKVLENTYIHVANGLVYDWKKNVWVDKIDIGDLVSESNKIIHVLSVKPSEFSCVVECSLCVSKEPLQFTIQNTIKKVHGLDDVNVTTSDIIANLDGFTDLTKYKYRQRTQQLLYEANLYNFNDLKRKDPLTIFPNHIDDYDDFCKMHYDNGKLLKAKMKCLLKEMQQFLDPPVPPLEKVEPNDPDFCTTFAKSGKVEPNLYKLLCDDIYICLHTFNSSYGAMYSCARQTSQGAQRSYSATYTPRVDKGNDCNNININNFATFRNGGRPPKLMRSYAFNGVSSTPFPDFTDDDINLNSLCDNFYKQNDDNDLAGADISTVVNHDNEEYTLSDQIDNPYSTLSILELMRSCSASVDESKNELKLFRFE